MADYADTVAGVFRADLAGKVGEREMARLTGVTNEVVLNTNGPDGATANIAAGIGRGDELGNFQPGV
jgi:hypothetical protein